MDSRVRGNDDPESYPLLRRRSGSSGSKHNNQSKNWLPACAGMTTLGVISLCGVTPRVARTRCICQVPTRRKTMARVPVITSPCPLRFASMPSVGRDFCGQCKRRVHNLDGMNDAQRAVFFANCSGEVCVAYTVRGPALLAAALGLGAAAAAALTSLPASAQDSGAKPASTVPVVQTGPTCDPKAKTQAIDSLQGVMMGGTSAAQ